MIAVGTFGVAIAVVRKPEKLIAAPLTRSPAGGGVVSDGPAAEPHQLPVAVNATAWSAPLAVSRRVASGCRYLTADGKLSGVKPCGSPLVLIARGARSWTVKARAPRGTYRVRWQAIDASGNLERAHAKTVRVR